MGTGHLDEVREELEDLFLAFADADHDAGLRDAALGLDAGEHFHRPLITSTRSHGWVAAFDGLEVVGDDVWLSVDDHLKRRFVALEVADEDLDGHIRAGFSRPHDGLSPDSSAAIRLIVAIHTRDHDVLEPRTSQRLRNTAWLVLVDR